MNINDLQRKLVDAYSVNNLNRISLTLINLYKTKHFSALQQIAAIINDFIPIVIAPDGKGFNKLIMLYHPDRSVFHIQEINKLALQNNINALLPLSHIFELDKVEEYADLFKSKIDIDFSSVYEWDANVEGFTIIEVGKGKPKAKAKEEKQVFTFYDAVKIRQYGSLNINFPSYYLEDFDEYELSSSGINDLDGIEFCLHVKYMDLSGNQIADLSLLEGLSLLEELNLSDNQIYNIESLSHLTRLKKLYLSNNHINDLTPLFELPALEYLDITGNDVDLEHIEELIDLDVQVDS